MRPGADYAHYEVHGLSEPEAERLSAKNKHCFRGLGSAFGDPLVRLGDLASSVLLPWCSFRLLMRRGSRGLCIGAMLVASGAILSFEAGWAEQAMNGALRAAAAKSIRAVTCRTARNGLNKSEVQPFVGSIRRDTCVSGGSANQKHAQIRTQWSNTATMQQNDETPNRLY